MVKFNILATLTFCSIFLTTSSFIENRITHKGSNAINNVPYQVSIRYKKNNSSPFEHRCSGTVYSSKVILTTATCLISLQPLRLHVKAGSPYRTKTEGYLYLVDKYIIHPDYNIWLSDNDLALVILRFDLPKDMQKEVANITLSDNIPKAGSWATKFGWGRTEAGVNSDLSEGLQTADVNIVNNTDCQRAYGQYRISQAMLCATTDKVVNACSGDAGGALVYNNNALGLKSWGFQCGNSILPDVYTNLVYFKKWIENEIAKL